MSVEIETSGSRFRVNQVSDAYDRLISDKEPVVFFGEAQFSFSTAVAAARGSWYNILATNFDDDCASAQDSIHANIAELKGDTPIFQLRNSNYRYTCVQNLRGLFRSRARPFRLYDINASGDISEQLSDQGFTPGYWCQNLFFQCPWVPTRHDSVGSGVLLRDFLLSAASVQESGEYAFVGIANHQRYIDNYDLRSILSTYEEDRVKNYYTFVGADPFLPRTALDHGYQHRPSNPNMDPRDLHEYLFDTHVTLCFKRSNGSNPVSNSNSNYWLDSDDDY